MRNKFSSVFLCMLLRGWMIPGIAIFIVWKDVYLTVMNILCV